MIDNGRVLDILLISLSYFDLILSGITLMRGILVIQLFILIPAVGKLK